MSDRAGEIGRLPAAPGHSAEPEPVSRLGHSASVPSAKLKVLSLFAGIGGFDLGLERTGGFETVAFCEIDKKAQAVLRKHWPKVPIYDDVTSLTAEQLAADGIAVDVICGGFPCQDISTAGLGAGIAEGTRSGLWSEYSRLIGELRPRHVIVENVSALLGRGLDRVLGDLASIGYDADWHCIPASALGAPHRRDRIWIMAHPTGELRNGGWMRAQPAGRRQSSNGCKALADPQGQRCGEEGELRCDEPPQRLARSGKAMADAASIRLPGQGQPVQPVYSTPDSSGEASQPFDGCLGSIWAVEPNVGRVAHGVPGRVDRLKQLGNAVVPQIPELIGRAILEAERAA